jgi:hypothetical protein
MSFQSFQHAIYFVWIELESNLAQLRVLEVGNVIKLSRLHGLRLTCQIYLGIKTTITGLSSPSKSNMSCNLLRLVTKLMKSAVIQHSVDWEAVQQHSLQSHKLTISSAILSCFCSCLFWFLHVSGFSGICKCFVSLDVPRLASVMDLFCASGPKRSGLKKNGAI